MKIAQYHGNFAQSISPNRKQILKNGRRIFKYHQSGKFLPNLVTLFLKISRDLTPVHPHFQIFLSCWRTLIAGLWIQHQASPMPPSPCSRPPSGYSCRKGPTSRCSPAGRSGPKWAILELRSFKMTKFSNFALTVMSLLLTTNWLTELRVNFLCWKQMFWGIRDGHCFAANAEVAKVPILAKHGKI